jgi:hypothetical protein
MQLVKKLLGLDERVDAISLRVRPITHGGFGVYANVVLIAIHDAQSEADAHCQRLLHQQAQE